MKNWGAISRWSGAGSGLFAFLALALALVSPPPAAAQSETRIRFSLDRAFDGTAGPLFLAMDKGYFEEESVYVEIEPAQSPMEAITRLALANGATEPTHDMSLGDFYAMIRYRDQNPATGIEAVFIAYDKPTYALIGRKSRGIQFVKDTENRRLAAPAMDPAAQLWPLFAKLNAIDTTKVTVMNVGLLVRVPMLVSGEVDALIGHSFAAYVDLKDRGVPADDLVVLLMADYGMKPLYGSAFMASAKFQAEHPEAIKGFLRAYVKALRDTIRKPEEAIDAVMKRMPGANKALELERLKIVLSQNIRNFDPKDETVGGVDPTRFAASLELLAQNYTFKSKLKPEEYFDAQYLPAPPKPEAPRQQPQKKKKR
ncbi:MAG: ABC transporter substrate-binding protein [Xanthobacteraceae bacterium]|nr:ABC transporter substrate-binding protein [Xanthobacteraceae bacterium]